MIPVAIELLAQERVEDVLVLRVWVGGRRALKAGDSAPSDLVPVRNNRGRGGR